MEQYFILRDSKLIRRSIYFLVGWSVFVILSFVLNLIYIRNNTIEYALQEARSLYRKDIIYRKWNSMNNGIYVAVSEDLKPNDLITGTSRDIVIDSLKTLTLVNPDYMTRLIYKLSNEEYGINGKLASLRPTRPENTPDDWEINALKKLKAGSKEEFILEEKNGLKTLKSIKPLTMDDNCLGCHAKDGYTESDLSGGITITLPMESYFATESKQIMVSAIIHAFFWAAGIILIFLGFVKINKDSKYLADSEARNKLLSENIHDVIWTINLNTMKFSYISPSIYNLRGITEAEAMQETLDDSVTPESKQLIIKVLTEHLQSIEQKNDLAKKRITEIVQPKKDGTLINVEVVTSFLFDGAGKPIEIVGISRDITARKRSEENLKNLVNNIPEYIVVYRNDNIIFTNKAVEKGLGYEEGSLLGTSIYEVIHEKYWNIISEKVIKRLSGETLNDYEIEIYNSKKELRDVLVRGSLINYEDLPAIMSILIDITERKQIEARIREREKWFRHLYNLSPVMMYSFDEEGYITNINEKWLEVLGYRKDEVIGNTLDFVMTDDSYKNHNESLEKLFWRNGSAKEVEFQFIKKNQDIIDVLVDSIITKDTEGKRISLNVMRDITKQKQAEMDVRRYMEELYINKDLLEERARELVELNVQLSKSEDELKEMNASKDKFFSIISHDLKNPFTSFLGFIRMISEDFNDLSREELRQFLDSIHKSADNLYQLLEGLLEWSRIQTGRIKFNPINVSIDEIIYSSMEVLRNNAEFKRITFKYEPTSLKISADNYMLATVFRNLLSNAIKFSEQETAILIGVSQNENETLFSIKDNGIGMSEDSLKKIFRIDQHHTTIGTSKEKGTGLGLILCKEMIEMHQGRIWAESETGKGSTFLFTVPKLNGNLN